MIDWLRGRKTFSSLLSGFCVIGLIIIIPGLLVTSLNDRTAVEVLTLREKVNPHYMSLIKIDKDLEQLQIQLLGISLKKTTAANNLFSSEIEQLFQNIKNQIDTSIKQHDRLGKRELSLLLKKLNVQIEHYFKLSNEVANFYIENNPQESGAILEEFYQQRQQISLTMQALSSGYLNELDKSLVSITENTENTSYTILVTSLILVIAILSLSFCISRILNSSIAKVNDYTDLIANGDLSTQPEVKYANETGKLMKSIASISSFMQETVDTINRDSKSSLSCSSELSDLSIQLNNKSDQAYTQLMNVAGLSKEVNSHLKSMLEEVDSTAINFKSTALTAAEITARIAELSHKSGQASSLAIKASEKSLTASAIVEDLDQATQEIGMMAETITEISEKTNLLALNATIEAARAGEAGKGFSVVANEVKELARQTAQATIEIQNRISSVKESTERTITEIHEVSRMIHDANMISQEVSVAIQEQSQVTEEIVQNITDASLEIDEVGKHTAQITDTTTQVTTNITDISLLLTEVVETSEKVHKNTNNIKKIQHNSKELLARFKI